VTTATEPSWLAAEQRLWRLSLEHGSEEERAALNMDLRTMRQLREVFPQSRWEPSDRVRLIDWFFELGGKIASRRFHAAKQLRYGDHQGKIGRTLEEERATVRAQIATQLLLGLPLGKPDTYQEARQVGNIGGGNTAFLPLANAFQHHLIVSPRLPRHFTCWLIVPETERIYHLAGWIPADEAKDEAYKRTREREGGQSVAYWVPVGALRSVEEWWAFRA
jgi:hypothetical protein